MSIPWFAININNNLSGTKITVDILSDALNAGDGIHEYNLNGSSYTGNLPKPNYAYGNGTVYKRNKSAITVVLYGCTQEPIATNYSADGKTWLGWKVHALKSDLDSFAEKKLDLSINDFNSYIKPKTNRVSFFAFNDTTNSPFSFQTGFCIAFNHNYLIRTDQFCLIGISDDGTKIEAKRIQIS